MLEERLAGRANSCQFDSKCAKEAGENSMRAEDLCYSDGRLKRIRKSRWNYPPRPGTKVA